MTTSSGYSCVTLEHFFHLW